MTVDLALSSWNERDLLASKPGVKLSPMILTAASPRPV